MESLFSTSRGKNHQKVHCPSTNNSKDQAYKPLKVMNYNLSRELNMETKEYL